MVHNKCFIHIQLYPRQKSICQNVSHLMKHPIICDNEQIMKKNGNGNIRGSVNIILYCKIPKCVCVFHMKAK